MMAREIGRRALLASGAILVTPISSVTPADAADTWELQQAFFAGTYFDPFAPAARYLAQFLIQPVLRTARRPQPREPLKGSELNPVVKPLIERDAKLRRLLRLTSMDSDQGNPIAIYISRAQHDSFRFQSSPTTPPLYVTVVSLALSLDIFTDQAAYEQSRRFQSLFSHLMVFERRIELATPPSEQDLADHYKETLFEALGRLAARIEPQLRFDRTRMAAAFQVERFNLPSDLSPQMRAILLDAVPNGGRAVDQVPTEEQRRVVQRELAHLLNYAIVDELNRRSVSNIVMLPPLSVWSDSRILSLLKTRRGVPSDISVLNEIDVTQVNGYKIVAAAVRDTEVAASTRDYATSKIYGVQLAARIMRPRPGAAPLHVPSGIADPARKTVLASAGQTFIELTDAPRSSRREVVLDAFRRAAQEAAPNLVSLMMMTAQEINS
jgi:hypothetical protein